MTTRQETICRDIWAEMVKVRDDKSSAYAIGYYEGLKRAHDLAMYATEYTRDPLTIPLIDLGYITR